MKLYGYYIDMFRITRYNDFIISKCEEKETV